MSENIYSLFDPSLGKSESPMLPISHYLSLFATRSMSHQVVFSSVWGADVRDESDSTWLTRRMLPVQSSKGRRTLDLTLLPLPKV